MRFPTTSTLIHLIRHGSYELVDQALGGRGDYPLAREGREQAARIAATLRDSRVGMVLSSPVQRALETAEPIASRLDVPLQSDPAFAEIDFATWTGMRFEELDNCSDWHAWNTFRSTAGVPGGETMLAVQARALAGLTRHAAGAPEGEFAIVSHADVIKSMLAHFLGTPLDLMRRIEIAPGSISQLALYQDDAKVLAINMQP